MVTMANEEISIVSVLQSLGVELPDDVGSGRSRKMHCPFGGIYHSDNGVDPAMRVYPESNSAYCFSCSSYFSPVGLAAKAMDVNVLTAATRLLERAGYRPTDLAQAWQRARTFEPEPDTALMADALKTYCRRIDPGWARRQFEPGIAAALTRCLALLDLVRSGEDVALWLAGCKTVMRRSLHRDEPSAREENDL